ncbi:MAG: flagellar motor protein MotB [Pseudomonadales bacterium]|nr:flagellar motor protein MotB [Pseudomonadales bacterium]MCP5330286.1 flagellar motor protein MotB [Pseudomonadales bacterium]MCP5344098.1 flagellar motor protein MotB [Pseudomonadales bacterium]
MEKSEQNVIIKRVKKVDGGAHGGAWKIAFADFALALMAFFLVLWLIESTTNLEKMAIAGYFSDPTNLGAVGDGGTPYVLDLQGRPLNVTNQGLNLSLVRQDEDTLVDTEQEMENPEFVELARLRQQEAMARVQGEIEAEINLNQQFEWFRDSVTFEITEEGLMVQIIDREGRPLFDSGQSRLRPYAMEILWAMGRIFGNVPNKVSVFGHTDSARFSSEDTYSNWELSADRANAARRALVDGGLHPDQIAQIIGMADSVPLDPENPDNAMNRRIVIMVLNAVAQSRVDALSAAGRAATTPSPEILPPSPTVEIF